MCWSVPGKVVEIKGNAAKVEISGIFKDVGLDLINDVKIGDYLLVHAGYAIQKVDEEKAKFTIDFMQGKFSKTQMSTD